MFTLKLIAAVAFMLTGGAVFSDRFKRFRALAVVAAVVSFVSAYFLLNDVVQVASQNNHREQRQDPVSVHSARSDERSLDDQADTAALCDSSTTQWSSPEQSASSRVLRSFLDTVPSQCLQLRHQVELSILEAEVREATEVERASYDETIRQRTRVGYTEFLRHFPAGPNSEDVRRRLASCSSTLQRVEGERVLLTYRNQDYTGAPWDAQSDGECRLDLISQCNRRRGELSAYRVWSVPWFPGYQGVLCDATCTNYTTQSIESCE